MLFSLLQAQLVATFQLALPVIFVYSYYSQYLFSVWGVVLCSCVMGMYAAWFMYFTTKKTANGLKFAPSGEYASLFNDEIERCGLRPTDVAIRYAFADECIAMTFLNTIVVDPMIWKGVAADEEFVKARSVVETYVAPSFSEDKKVFYACIDKALTEQAQKFIFRHELGHVVAHYSLQLIVLTGCIRAVATIAGICSAFAVIDTVGGLAAAVIGVVCGAIVDLCMSYANNVFFKAREEVHADRFAIQFSTAEEINAAADFFEQYDAAAQDLRNKTLGILASVPTIILLGYVSAQERVRYLRSAAARD